MPFNFESIVDPFGYLEDANRFVSFLTSYTSRVAPLHRRYGVYYTDEEIETITFTRDNGTDGRLRATGQESGLPIRITGKAFGFLFDADNERVNNSNLDIQRKEPVTENQIGWRVDILGDFIYGEVEDESRMVLESDLPESNPLKERIDELLLTVAKMQHEPNWYHEFYNVGAVHGFVDVALRMDERVKVEVDSTTREQVRWLFNGEPFRAGDFVQFGKALQWHIASPLEIVPLVIPRMPNQLWGWVLHYKTQLMPGASSSDNVHIENKQKVDWIELYTDGQIQTYKLDPKSKDRGYQLVQTVTVPEDLLPVVHMQHLVRRNEYRGKGEVEPLIPMQDELNTRLSDRGRGITFGANPPWLGKGIEGFESLPFGPDVKYSGSDEASMERLTGDTKDAGQDGHIDQARDAMDRISSIPPLAAGDIKDQIGSLTSAVALRTVLRGMLAKLARVRMNHARAFENIAFGTLAYANATGVLITTPEERGICVKWGASVEESLIERLEAATLKKAIGVPDKQLQIELDYTEEEVAEFEALAAEKNKELFGSMADNEDDNT
jgi:hypothetical protein